MNNEEAVRLLEQELAHFRDQSYADLVHRIAPGSLHYERPSAGGRMYQEEVQVFRDDEPGGNIRVMGSIDDGGLRAFVPLNRSFITSADDTLVGD